MHDEVYKVRSDRGGETHTLELALISISQAAGEDPVKRYRVTVDDGSERAQSFDLRFQTIAEMYEAALVVENQPVPKPHGSV